METDKQHGAVRRSSTARHDAGITEEQPRRRAGERHPAQQRGAAQVRNCAGARGGGQPGRGQERRGGGWGLNRIGDKG
jgi:hypothetical protein